MTPDGWLRTGDAARSDEQGYIWIVDRIADRFFSAGQPVYPAEVERVLIGHPSIADAGVVQVPAPHPAIGTGGRGIAFIVVAAGATLSPQELVAYGRRRLPPHPAPANRGLRRPATPQLGRQAGPGPAADHDGGAPRRASPDLTGRPTGATARRRRRGGRSWRASR